MKYLILSAAALLTAACTEHAEAPAAETAAAEKLHNNITEAEIIEGWELMFDGQCTGNLRRYRHRESLGH